MLGAFTLLELLVVAGLVAVLSFVFVGGLGGGGKAAALQSAQATLMNLITAARTKAMASGRSARILVHVDVLSASEPRRYLRYLAIQIQTDTGWQTAADPFLPEGIYIVPGNFAAVPSGLFAAGPVPWTRNDGSALCSTALRSNQITTETINGTVAEQWVGIVFSAQGGTMQSGDIVLAPGKVRPPGSYSPGESPAELDQPENVRGLTLSSYGVPALVNGRRGF